MNTKKHKLSLLMAGVLLFSSLTACNNNNNKPSESNTGADGEGNKPAEIMNEEGLPIIKEGQEYSFKIFVDDSSEDDDFVMLKQFEEKILMIFSELAKKDKGLEINTSGLRQKYGKTFPDFECVRLFRECGGKIISIGSDAHKTADQAD